MLAQTDYVQVEKSLRESSRYDVEYRAMIDGVITWHRMTVTSMVDGSEILVGLVALDKEILLSHIDKTIQDDYYGIYAVDFEDDIVKAVKTRSLIRVK